MSKNNSKTITLIGNPNVGKSSIFNYLTGLNQHTGNWTGKTVESAVGKYKYNNKEYTIIDLPGTYSLMSVSKEEEVSTDFICFNKYDLAVVVIDATMLERNFNLVVQTLQACSNVIICVNLMDEAIKKGIKINLKKLSEIFKVPVVGTSINDKKSLEKLVKEIEQSCIKKNNNNNYMVTYNSKIEDVIKKVSKVLLKHTTKDNVRFLSKMLLCNDKEFNKKVFNYLKIKDKEEIENIINICINYLKSNGIQDYQNEIISSTVNESFKIYKSVTEKQKEKSIKIDKVLSSKIYGIPIMILFICIILWITIIGANYPSKLLSKLLFSINNHISKFLISINLPSIIRKIIVDGILKTLAWVISVMLPPMAIFFPLFTLLEESGFLPRLAFNMDKLFSIANCHGKQSLTMCMGLGCNSCGVTGCRIIESKKDRIIAILTNSFIPCNGRFPSLIAIITMFFAIGKYSSVKSTLILTFTIIISVLVTLIISKLLSLLMFKNKTSSFILEIPPFRKPNIKKVIIRSIIDKTLKVLGRAVSIAAPFGLVIWIMANISLNGISILKHCILFLEPIANIFGVDGTILMALILGFPANEIVIPIILMGYLNKGTLIDYGNLYELKNLFISNGWTIKTAICTLFLILFHFPCSTTMLTIKKETNSKILTLIAFILPTITGLTICLIINLIFSIF